MTAESAISQSIDFKPGRFFTWSESSDYHAWVERKNTGQFFIHLTVKTKWTKSLKEQIMCDLLDFMEWVKTKYQPQIYVLIPFEDKKLLKFQSLFGFEIDSVWTDQQDRKFTLMSQKVI